MSLRCVVTGGAGVIGQRLVEMLRARGDRVRVVDLLAPPTGLDPEVDYVQGDLVDLGGRAISDFDPEVVFHLAAAFERSDEHPEFWRENAHHNVEVSRRVLEGATNSANLRRYVFASSYLIYDPELYLSPEPPSEPVTLREDAPIDPRNACGAAKLLHEKEIELASADPELSFSTISARIYRVYGQSSRDIISRWVRDSIRGIELNVYGVESFFDYVLADDVAEGLLRLGDVDLTGVVNLASGRSHRVQDVLECLQRHIPGLEIDGPHAAETYERSQASLHKLKEAIGWAPSTSLEQGVADLVRHERANLRDATVSRRVLPPRRANVMISSLSRKAGVVQAVRRAQEALNLHGTVWGADTDASAPARLLVDEFWHAPRLDDLDDDEIADVCRRNEIQLVIPTRDGELTRFAALRDRLATEGTTVPIGSPTSIATGDDKLEFAAVCQANGLAVVPTANLPSADLGDRLVVKPRRGAGSADIRLDLTLEEAREIVADRVDVVVQPYCRGTEYSVDLYIRLDGEPLGAVVRAREVVSSGESVVTRTADRPDIADLAMECARSIDVRGHALVQVIDADDGPLLLECNSRVGGASAAAWAAGLRSIDAMLLESLGEQPPPFRFSSSPLAMTRLPHDRFAWG